MDGLGGEGLGWPGAGVCTARGVLDGRGAAGVPTLHPAAVNNRITAAATYERRNMPGSLDGHS
jgi:hypothetical protein